VTTAKVFICYRRSESQYLVSQLADFLRKRLGKANVFLDIDTIDAGQNFLEIIDDYIRGSDAVIAVIGPMWISAATERSTDHVAQELLAARRHGRRIIPVLHTNYVMPSPEEFPEHLRWLTELNAVSLGGTAELARDAEKLAEVISPGVTTSSARRKSSSGRATRSAIAVVAAVSLVVVAAVALGRGDSGADSTPAITVEADNAPQATSQDATIRPNPGNAVDCSDFATYEEAKEWFDTYFNDFGDVAELDSDGDGEPCESLRFPTPTTTMPSSPSATAEQQNGNPGNAVDCSDFATYEEAKEWFDTYFEQFGDVAKLDVDGDGEPCESLRSP